jgi:hypothetical protein
VILTVESEEEEESDSSETEKEDDEGIIFVARATSEVLQEGKVSGNALPVGSLPCADEAGSGYRIQGLTTKLRALEPGSESRDTNGL